MLDRWKLWLFLGVLAGSLVRAAPTPALFIELDIAIERGGTTGFLFDYGDGIWGENSVGAPLPPRADPQPVRLRLPERPIRGLRFDPTDNTSSVLIAGMRLVDESGTVLLRMDPRQLKPMNDIASIAVEGAGIRVQPGGIDPMLRWDIGPLQKRIHETRGLPTVGRTAVALLALGFLSAIGGGVWLAWRRLGARGASVAGVAIFAVVLGGRLMALQAFGRPVPFWDEWEGDAAYVLIPFTGGFLDWGALVMPQWEHRILLTRIISLCGTWLNGEWDVRVAMTVSACLYSAMVAIIGTALAATRHLVGVIAALVLAALATLPFDVNNLLWGGQTQMYGLLLLAVTAMALAAGGRVTGVTFLAAFGVGVASLFTMGAGMLGPACAAGILLLRGLWEPSQRGKLGALAALNIALALLGVLLHTSSRAHVPLYATSFEQFERAFVGAMAWPLRPHVVWAMLLWTPPAWNAFGILRRREASALEWIALGLSVWSLINAAALGYARQYEGPPFDSRFFTPLSMGGMASFCSSVAWLLRARAAAGRILPIGVGCALVLAWFSVGWSGIDAARETGNTRADIDHRIRTFLATGDSRLLIEKPPHHTGLVVVDRLESTFLQRILPAPYRRALAARAGGDAAQAEAGPVTITVRTLMKCGMLIGVAGLAGAGWVVWQRRPREPGRRVRAIVAAWRAVPRARIADTACHGLAVAVTLGWALVYHAMQHHGLVDEGGHLANIHHFLDRKPGWPEAMPMLPGYHYIVVSVWGLFPQYTTLAVARAVTVVTMLVALAAFARLWSALHDTPSGRPTLLFALCPLIQPFAAMAYTDVPAMAFVLAAAWAQVTGRRAFAALTLLGAIGLRQTNLAWVGFFIFWEGLRIDAPREPLLRRVRWLVALLGVAVAVIVTTGRLTVGTQHGNAFSFNIASVHSTGLLLFLLGLPVWFAHARQSFTGWSWRRRWLAVVGSVAIAGALAVTYANPHIWNRELYWEGCTFTLLRNWPLVGMDQWPALRVVSGIVIVLAAWALVSAMARQREWRALALVVFVGLLPTLTNALVEPRYLIPGVALALVFFDYPPADWRRLVLWWAALSALHAPFIARSLSLW